MVVLARRAFRLLTQDSGLCESHSVTNKMADHDFDIDALLAADDVVLEGLLEVDVADNVSVLAGDVAVGMSPSDLLTIMGHDDGPQVAMEPSLGQSEELLGIAEVPAEINADDVLDDCNECEDETDDFLNFGDLLLDGLDDSETTPAKRRRSADAGVIADRSAKKTWGGYRHGVRGGKRNADGI